MKKQLRTIRFLTVLLLVSMLLITGCRSTKPGGKGGDNGNGDPQLPGYNGMEVVEMAKSLGLGWEDSYPERVTVGGDEISLADAVYLMAKWIVLFDGTNAETGQPGKVPEIVPYKQISLPNKVTPGKTDGVVVWHNVNKLAKDIVDALDVDPQIPDEITVLWHPSGDWNVIKDKPATEEILGINIVISILARSINWAKDHEWMFANYVGVRGGDLPDSWLKPAEDPVTYALTLAAAPADGGVVTDNTNAGPYAEGAKINVTATANEGYNFVNWTVDGTVVSDQATFEYTMPAKDVTLTANFAKEGD